MLFVLPAFPAGIFLFAVLLFCYDVNAIVYSLLSKGGVWRRRAAAIAKRESGGGNGATF